ncbi:uncharacterized protein [Dendrobates tinctorius]|uniref:uncharacterized protein n=1 Tax=Dendrobates tinctorius TaxID=92724 RepID=UPI003CC9F129
MVDPSKCRTGKCARPITYPDIPSSIAPVSQCPELPTPILPEGVQPSSGECRQCESEEDNADPEYSFEKERTSYYPNQKDLNNLIRDLGLTKSNAELLTFSLKQWNLLDESINVAHQRKHHQTFASFFSQQEGLCFCNNVAGLFEAIVIMCNSSEWNLFIDSSSRSLKAILLHNRNKYLSLPVVHSVHIKEDCTSINLLLCVLKYEDYGWDIIGDFIMVTFLMGLQGGFTECPCFLCLWESWDTNQHYHRLDWPQRTEFSVRNNNVKWGPDQTVCHSSPQRIGSLQVPTRSLSLAVWGKDKSWHLCRTTNQADSRERRICKEAD